MSVLRLESIAIPCPRSAELQCYRDGTKIYSLNSSGIGSNSETIHTRTLTPSQEKNICVMVLSSSCLHGLILTSNAAAAASQYIQDPVTFTCKVEVRATRQDIIYTDGRAK